MPILIVSEIYLGIFADGNRLFRMAELPMERITNVFGNYNAAETILLFKDIMPSKKKYKISYPVIKMENVTRIICCGSSPTEGTMLSFGTEAYPSILENIINASTNKKVEVINAGFNGDFCMHVMYFQEVLIKLMPDIVIFYVPRNYIEKSFLVYKKTKELRLEHSDWIHTSELLCGALAFKKPNEPIVRLYNFLCKSSLFLFMERVRFKVNDQAAQSSFGRNENILKQLLEDTVQLCKERKIKIILIPQVECSHDPPIAIVKNSASKKTLEVMKSIAKGNDNVYFLDVQGVFADGNNRSRFFDATHFTRLGTTLIAQTIYKKLKKENLL